MIGVVIEAWADNLARRVLVACRLSPVQGGKERWKKEADLSRLVGDGFGKQGNSHTSLS